MTRPDIDAIKARVGVATEGPWEKSEALDSTEYGDYMAYGVHEVAPITQYWDSAPAHTSLEVMSAEDAEFIAHARQDVPELLAYVEKLEAQIELVREYHQPVMKLRADGNASLETAHFCTRCHVTIYPCPTIQTLGEEK